MVVSSGEGDFDRYRRMLEERGEGGWRPRVRVVSVDHAEPGDLSGPLLVVGPSGPLVKAYLDRTPLGQSEQAGDGELVRALGVNPWDAGSPMVVITAPTETDLRAYLTRFGWLRTWDYEVVRDGTRVRYGRYAAAPGEAWRIDTSSDVDLRPQLASVEEAGVRAEFVTGEFGEERARAIAARTGRDLKSFLKRLGSAAVPAGLQLVLYPDVEAKAVRSDDPRPSHFEGNGDRPRVHLVVTPGPGTWDRIGLARAAVSLAIGRIASKAVADGVAVWLTGAMLGRDLDWWAARLEASGSMPDPMALMDDHVYRSRTYLVGMPAAGLFVRRLMEKRPPSEIPNLLRDPAKLRDAAGRAAPVAQPSRHATMPRPKDLPFQKGIALAHEGYAVVDGYGSQASVASLMRIKMLGVAWVALSPYGFMREPDRDEISFLRLETQPAGGENDQALLATIDAAHRLGLRVMLKPQIWLSGDHWTGEISMRNETSWKAFFLQYREFVTHYALLAEAGGADILAVGVELQAATRREADWRDLIARARSLYGGPLTYAANWGEEFERIGFWDALDYAGLDCYYPLDADAGADDRRLAEGARLAAERAAQVARRSGRSILLTEVGFPALSAAWTSPHDDRGARAEDAEAQARGYRAILAAFWDQPWLAGLYWWKWPSTPEKTGKEPLFSPRGRPAEAVLAAWYSRSRPKSR